MSSQSPLEKKKASNGVQPITDLIVRFPSRIMTGLHTVWKELAGCRSECQAALLKKVIIFFVITTTPWKPTDSKILPLL